MDIFKRINSTKYSLNEIEINNAVYTGALMSLAQGFAEHEFFETHQVFRPTDIKRMGDVRFVLQLIITMLGGYFDRDETLEKYLSDFNEEFPLHREIGERLIRLFDFVTECGFQKSSRIWKRSDLFTAMVSLDRLFEEGHPISPSEALDRLERFYVRVDEAGMDAGDPAVAIYAKAAIQASNDRINRVRRGIIVESVLSNEDPIESLVKEGLL